VTAHFALPRQSKCVNLSALLLTMRGFCLNVMADLMARADRLPVWLSIYLNGMPV
jgi:hypothetical protein